MPSSGKKDGDYRVVTKNPSFSLRAFGRKLGMNSGALSGLLSGKRRVSRKLAERIADRLMLDPAERERLLSHFARPVSRTAAVKECLQLSADQFAVVAEWYHFAILMLTETVGFREDDAWIARRLGIARREARAGLERLKRIGVLIADRSGKLRMGAPAYKTPDEVPSVALRRSHAVNLELAARSLERDELSIRSFTAITMAIDPRKLSLAKKRIREFQDEMSELLESGAKTEVYKLCIQLFPLTEMNQPKGRKDDE